MSASCLFTSLFLLPGLFLACQPALSANCAGTNGNTGGLDTAGLHHAIELLESDTARMDAGSKELLILHHSRNRFSGSSDMPSFIRTLTYIALYHEKQNHLDSAIHYMNLARETANRENLPSIAAWAELKLYMIYRKSGKYSDGIINLEKALADPGAMLRRQDSVRIYNRLGFFYDLLGKNITAVNYYFKALDKAKRTNDMEQLAIIYNNIGNSYLNAGATGDALRYFNEGIAVYAGEREMKVPILYNNVALIHEQNGNYDLAVHFIRKCLENSSPTMYDNIAEVAIHMSRVWLQKSQPDSARKYALIATYNALQLGESSLEYIRSLIQLAAVNRNDPVRMKSLLKKAFLLSDNGGLWSELARSSGMLADIYRDETLYDSAFFFLQIKGIYEDSLARYSAMESLLLKAQEASLDSLVVASKILEIEKNNLRLKVTSRNIVILLVSLVSGSLILSALLLLANLRRKRQLMRLDLELKEFQITSRTKELLGAKLEIEAQTEAIRRLKQNLKERLSRAYDAEFNDLSALLNQAERSLSEKERKGYIQELIKLSDSNFHQKLKQRYNQLTDDELKLAGLIRLNLSSDELTRIFQISRESLNKKRYRLRRKLGLNPNVTLDQFIYDFH